MQMWRVRDMAQAPSSLIRLQSRNGENVAVMRKSSMQRFLLAHLRILREAGVHAELVLVEGKEPNAFVGLTNGRTIVAVNLAMMELVAEDIDEFAFLLGHEVGHLAKGHIEAGKTRANTLGAVGSLVGVGLGMAGVPAGGSIAGLAVDLIDATFSRDQEREADALGIGYVRAVGYDAHGAIRLHEKLIETSGRTLLPFLSGTLSSLTPVKLTT
jgi:predicted Zn-dependent protease